MHRLRNCRGTVLHIAAHQVLLCTLLTLIWKMHFLSNIRSFPPEEALYGVFLVLRHSRGAGCSVVEIRGEGWIYSGTSDSDRSPIRRRVPTLPINAQTNLSFPNLTFFCLALDYLYEISRAIKLMHKPTFPQLNLFLPRIRLSL